MLQMLNIFFSSVGSIAYLYLHIVNIAFCVFLCVHSCVGVGDNGVAFIFLCVCINYFNSVYISLRDHVFAFACTCTSHRWWVRIDVDRWCPPCKHMRVAEQEGSIDSLYEAVQSSGDGATLTVPSRISSHSCSRSSSPMVLREDSTRWKGAGRSISMVWLTHAHTHTHTQTHAHIYLCVYTHTHTHTQACMYACMPLHTPACMHPHTHNHACVSLMTHDSCTSNM